MKLFHAPRNIPTVVLDNIASMDKIATACRFSDYFIAHSTGIDPNQINCYRANISIPQKKNYNKLAAFFEWEVWE